MTTKVGKEQIPKKNAVLQVSKSQSPVSTSITQVAGKNVDSCV